VVAAAGNASPIQPGPVADWLAARLPADRLPDRVVVVDSLPQPIPE
jgi:hypothetical protein